MLFTDISWIDVEVMEKKTTSKRQRAIWVTLVIVVVSVGFRIALPYIVLRYANNTLAKMDGYRGHIFDIDIALIRGAYQLDSVYLNKVDSVSDKETPFFAASLVDLSIEWRALFKGKLVGEVVFQNPVLRFTRDKVEPKDVRKDSTQFETVSDAFMPLKINRMEARNARIRYVDENSHPRVDIALTNGHIIATNLRNSYDSSSVLPATVNAQADVYGGTLDLKMKLNPLAEDPTFDLNAEVKNTQLKQLNDFFQAYAKSDVNKGSFGMYTEIAAKDGKFKGYVKPFIKDLKVLGPEDKHDNILKKAWEGFVGTMGEVFENQRKDQFATKVPFQGSTESIKANVWFAVGHVLENAFVRAIQPSIDQEINIAVVQNSSPPAKGKTKKKNFFQRVFGKKEGGKSKREKRKAQREKEKS
jgi:hypothetical protein